jgi:DNA-binding response OmpR family regulator
MQHQKSILVVDDDPSVNSLLQDIMQGEGWETYGVFDGEEALNFIKMKKIDIIILDINLPKMDGIEVCKYITSHFSTPIIMLSARYNEEDKIRCLNLGADDYITKPFKIGELVARLKAILRRCQKGDLVSKMPNYTNHELELNFNARSFKVRGNDINLSQIESSLLQELIINAGKTLASEYLLHKVWGPEYGSEKEYLHVYINHLRLKIELDPKSPRYLINESGIGYKFVDTHN